MFNTILVGCDGTAGEADAIALAQQLRDPDHGRLVLASVHPFYRGFAMPALAIGYSAWLGQQSDETLHRAAADVAGDVPYERLAIASPSPAAGLHDLAEDVHADLIVLGASHRGPVGELAGRMTVQRLLHGAPCAVAVATPGQADRFGPSPRIAVAYDGSPEADSALDIAYAIAASTGAEVVLCHSIEPIIVASGFAGGSAIAFDGAQEEAATAGLVAATARAPAGVAASYRLQHGTPVERLALDLLPTADLVVAGSRGYGAMHRAIAGSTSAALLKNGRTPVLVTPRRPASERPVGRTLTHATEMSTS